MRALQDQEFQRLGGTRVLRTDARIVAATNRELERAITNGDFREDLYFRLNVITIPLPPLRERPEDVEALALHFLTQFGQELGRVRQGYSPEAQAKLLAHPWPGNVREMRNAIERAVLLSEGARIEASDLRFGSASNPGVGEWRPALPAGGVAMDEIERAVVSEALERHGFVQKEAAAWLRVSRRKLNYMIQKMGITHPSWRRNRDDLGEDAP